MLVSLLAGLALRCSCGTVSDGLRADKPRGLYKVSQVPEPDLCQSKKLKSSTHSGMPALRKPAVNLTRSSERLRGTRSLRLDKRSVGSS